MRGGPSSEYEVSLKSGLGVLAALEALGYKTRDIVITKRGDWLVKGFTKMPEQALAGIDAVFIALHGAYGEDGTVQRILDRLKVPYTGSNAFSSAVAMNKVLTKDLLKKQEVPFKMARHVRLARSNAQVLAQALKNIADVFGPEYVVKPVNGGSSIGTVMSTAGRLFTDVTHAFTENEEIIIEERIRGKEATVGVLEKFRDQTLYALPSIEIVPPRDAEFFTLEAKYSGDSDEICPGRFSSEEKQLLEQGAQIVHQLLDLRQYSRSDFIVANDGIYFLEVNTLPGLTPQSLFPKALEAVGSSYNELINHLITTI